MLKKPHNILLFSLAVADMLTGKSGLLFRFIIMKF